MNKDKEAFKNWYSEDYAKIMWSEFKGDEIVEHTWFEACRYKQKEVDAWEKSYTQEASDHASTAVNMNKTIGNLQTRIDSLIDENAKLFEEAKRELAYKDKKIAYLEAECERVYHPIREFWNQEKDEEMKRLQAENKKLNEELADLKQKLEASESVIDCFYEASKKVGW